MARSNSRRFVFLLLALIQFWSNGFSSAGISAVNKTIKTRDGDIIDCIDIYKQSAFSHPFLKITKYRELEATNSSPNDGELFQSWHKDGECPLGTVPILRSPNIFVPLERIEQATPQRNGRFNTSSVLSRDSPLYEYAQAALPSSNYKGARGNLNVWIPNVANGEYSATRILLRSGHGNAYNSLEAGWIVKGGDNNARLYVYWSTGGPHSTGCFNHACPGFVQTSRTYGLGSVLKPVSTYGGKQYYIAITIKKDLKTNAWILVAGNQILGYWPSSIFTSLAESAQYVVFGGNIINTEPRGHHTTTQMGSGHFPQEGYGKAAVISNIGYMSMGKYFKFNDADNLTRLPAAHPNCYDLNIVQSPQMGDHIYYGGPGHNAYCQ